MITFYCSPVYRESSSSPPSTEQVSSPARKMESSPERIELKSDEIRDEIPNKIHHDELIRRILENRRQLLEAHQPQDKCNESPQTSPRHKSFLPYSSSPENVSPPLFSTSNAKSITSPPSPNRSTSSTPAMFSHTAPSMMLPLFGQNTFMPPSKSDEMKMMKVDLVQVLSRFFFQINRINRIFPTSRFGLTFITAKS